MSTKQQRIIIFALILLGVMSQVQTAILPLDGSSCCGDNSISVSGYGKIAVQPDIAIINVGATVTAKTSQAATQQLADKISQVLRILANNRINSKDIDTQYISIFPQYDYPDGKQQLVGQTASQTLQITVRNIDSKGGILGSLIDQLVTVNKIQFNSLVFDKENKSQAQKQARKLAFEDAKKKANQLALFADRSLGKALTIVDNSGLSNGGSGIYSSALSYAKSSTSVPVGTIDVSYNVEVKFLLK